MGDQRVGELIARSKPEKPGEQIERLRVRRKRMGLFVGDHLQTMLNAAQEIVSRHELIARRCVDPTVGCQGGERDKRPAIAQFGMTSAGDQLLGLDKEFDLANAAAPELYVVTFDGDLAMTAIGMNLPLHFMDMRDRGVVEVFTPDEG